MLRNIVIKLIRYSGIPSLVRFLFQRKKVTILYYHNIAPERFDRHLVFLKKRYSVISLQDYLSSLNTHLKNRLILTFDDGHEGNYKLLPVLQKHNIGITVFLTSGLINTNRHFWFLLKEMDETLKAKLKKISNDERLIQLMDLFGFYDNKEYPEAEALSADQIREMMQFTDFQSHSVTHPCLPLCSDEKAKSEIKASKTQIEELLKIQVNSLACPNGDYSSRELKIAMDSGYKCVLAANPGFNSGTFKNYVLRRISTNDTGNINELALRVTGIWGVFKRFRSWTNIFSRD